MSDSLDKFFHDQQANVSPATPPLGQWERIQEGKLIVEPTVKRSASLWWLVLAMGVGLGLGVPIGAYSFVEQCPAVADAKGVPVSAPVAPKSETRVANVAPSTALAPAAAPKDRDSHTLSGSMPKSKDALLLASSGSIDEQMVEHDAPSVIPMVRKELKSSTERAEMQTTKTSREAPRTMAEVLSAKPEKRKTTVESKVADQASVAGLSAFAQTPIASTQFGALQSTLAWAATNTKVAPVEIKGRKPHSLARWEVGAHMTPWLSRKTTNIEVYSSVPNGREGTEFIFDGDETVLYRERSESLELNQRFQVDVVNFEVARQFNNGIRLGLGLAWQPRKRSEIRNQDDLFNAQLLNDEWAVHFYGESESLWLSLGAGYTFRRRKRLQPYLGLYLGSRFYEELRFFNGMFRRSDGASGREEVFSFRRSGDFGDVFLFAQVGLHYQLNERVSLGLEIVPGLGLGGRYRF